MAEHVDGLLLTREEARLAASLAAIGIGTLDRRDGAIPLAAVRLVDQLAAFGHRNRDTQASGRGETANPAAAADLACSGPRIGVTAAAGRLGVSAQAVRRWCRRGDLIAWRSPAGGHWTIDQRSADALAARRAAGE